MLLRSTLILGAVLVAGAASASIAAGANTASTRRVTRERPCGRGPWLRASSPVRRQRTVAARTRIVSAAGIRLDPRKTARPFKGIICDDISELKNGTAARDLLVSGAGRTSSSRKQWIGR